MPQKEIRGSQILESTLDLSGSDGTGLTNVDALTLGGQSLGTGNNNIVQLNGSAQLPAVDGSLLLNLPAGGLFTEDGDDNILGGTGAGANLTAASGLNNFLAGVNAGNLLTTGDENIIIGNTAGSKLDTQNQNIIFGSEAAQYLQHTSSVIIGTRAGKGDVTDTLNASSNVMIGNLAGLWAYNCSNSVFVGVNSGIGNSGAKRNTGQFNTFLGSNTGRYNSTGGSNVAIGYRSQLGVNTQEVTGANNTAVGTLSLQALRTTCNSNTAIGANTGAKIVTGASNVMLGLGAGPTTDLSNKLFIDIIETDTPLIGGDFSANSVAIQGTLAVSGGVDALTSATTVVDVAAATAPTTGQVLTASSSTAAVWASPFVNNVIINGNFDVWQRGTTFATIASLDFGADRFLYAVAGTAVHTLNRSTDVPTFAQSGVLSNYSMHLDVTTADASIAAGDFCSLNYGIEGYDYAQIAGGDATLSFWVKAAKTGIHCIAFRNGGNDRSYIIEYTVVAADTWEKVFVTVPLTETAGTWDYINGLGLRITFALQAGTTLQTTANAWQTGNFIATSGQVNETDNVANNFRIAQVQFEKGDVASPFAFKGISETISDCQRYFVKSYDMAVDPGTASQPGRISIRTSAGAGTKHYGLEANLPTRMRSIPSMVWYSPNTGASGNIRNETAGSDKAVSSTTDTGESNTGPPVTGTVNDANLLTAHWTAEAEL